MCGLGEFRNFTKKKKKKKEEEKKKRFACFYVH